MISITVTGAPTGSGSVSFDFGKAVFEGASLISPDNTPMYDFAIYNANGALVLSTASIDAQYTKIVENFQLSGVCTFQISNAVDNGTYSVELFPR